MDQAMVLHNLEKALANIVTDEYTKEAVEDQKLKERDEIQQLFGYTNVEELDGDQRSLAKLKRKQKKISTDVLKHIFTDDVGDSYQYTNKLQTSE